MFLLNPKDGITPGDGSDETDGMCQKEDPNRRCLSSGECRRCKLIGIAYEGCDSATTRPICDANANTVEIEMDYSNPDWIPECVGCKNADGRNF